MILAAPLVIPFAKAVGLSVGTLGMAALADKVNDYIQDNPEESMKILSMIIPGAGIGQIFMSKEDKISLEDLDEMTDEEAQDLTKEEKAELMKQAGKSSGKNKRQTMIDISEKLGLSGPGREKQDIEYEVDERYDEGGVEEVSKPKFDYKRFFRKADGGSIDKVPAAPSQLVSESDILLGYRGPGGYQGGKSGPVEKGPSARDKAMGSGGKQKGGTNTQPSGGGGGGQTTTSTLTKNPFSQKNLQTHFTNNQLLADAVKKGILTNKEYNILGGYDATQTLGLGPIDTGVASLGYNIVQSILGNQPFSDIPGDVARNIKGATDISPELQTKYENIIGRDLASGGRVGLRYGGDTMGGPNDKSNRGRQDPMGGRSDFTASQIRSVDPSFRSNNQIFSGGNKLTDQTDINKEINKKVIEKLNELTPPVIDYRKQKFDNVEKFRTLKKNPIPFSPFRFGGTKNINKTLFENTLSELALSYPDINLTDEFGMIKTDNLKTVIDSAVATGKISPIEGLTLTQSITTEGDPSGIGLTYDNNLINFSTPDISQGDYTLGTNYQIGDLGIGSMFDVKNDALSQKKLSFDYGDGTLTGSQVTYPGSNFQTNELALNKNFNVTDNIDVNVKGDLSNLKMDGSTLYTDKSLTPSVTYTTNIGDGLLSLSGSKEIIGGGVKPNIGLNFSYPTSDTGKIGLTTNNLLSEDPTGNLSFTKNIGQYGDNTFLDASVEVDPFNTDQYTGMLKFQKKFADGGRVGFNLGGLLTGQAKNIYDTMSAAGYFTEDEIKNAIIGAGYEIPGASQTETTAPNIIGSQINQGRDEGPTRPTSEIITDFQESIINRQNKLNDPGKIATFIGDFIPQQRSIADMLASGQIDTRFTGGIPLGIGSMIAKALPDKYYDMSLADQITTQAYMGYTDPNTNIANRDPFGLNVRSAFGNYAEKAAEIVDTLEEKLARKGELSKYDQLRLDHYRNVTKTKQAAVADIGLINLAKEQEEKRQAEAAKRREIENRIISGGAIIQGSGDDGRGNITTRSGDTFAPGDYSDVAGTLADPREKMDYYRDGGLATMFVEKR